MSIEVSVLMSVYNGELYIKEAIQSILVQSLHSFELLITDDSSTDSTIEIIKSFDDSRIVLFQNKERKGLTANLVSMLQIAKGSFIARLDSDDISERNRLAIQVRYLNEHRNCFMVCSYAKAIGNLKGIIRTPVGFERIKATLLFYNPIVHSSVMFRNNNISYDTFFLKSQDYALWDYLVGKGYRIDTIPKALVSFRYHDDQISRKASDVQRKYRCIIEKRALARIGVEINQQDEKIWFSFLDGEKNFSIDEISFLVSVLKSIESGNSKVGLYDSKVLKKRLQIFYSNLYSILINKKSKTPQLKDISNGTPFSRKMLFIIKKAYSLLLRNECE